MKRKKNCVNELEAKSYNASMGGGGIDMVRGDNAMSLAAWTSVIIWSYVTYMYYTHMITHIWLRLISLLTEHKHYEKYLF